MHFGCRRSIVILVERGRKNTRKHVPRQKCEEQNVNLKDEYPRMSLSLDILQKRDDLQI